LLSKLLLYTRYKNYVMPYVLKAKKMMFKFPAKEQNAPKVADLKI